MRDFVGIDLWREPVDSREPAAPWAAAISWPSTMLPASLRS